MDMPHWFVKTPEYHQILKQQSVWRIQNPIIE